MKTSLMVLFASLVLCGCPGRRSLPPAGSAPSGGSAASEPRDVSTGSAANHPREEGPEKGAPGEQQSAQIWERFVSAWNAGDKAKLKEFRASQRLLTLDNPGAFVRLRLLDGVDGISALEGQYDLARLKRVRLSPTLESREAPKSSCEDDSPAQGTFVTPTERLRLHVRFRALGEYELASKEEIARLEGPVKAALENARFAVYDLSANVGFLFGEEDGRVVLLAIDAVIPCSA